MKIPSNKTGITTLGATGITLLAGVIWTDLSAWWLALAVLLILSAVGQENK
jgi:uncharacterized membrane protein YccF (DUF307 family)